MTYKIDIERVYEGLREDGTWEEFGWSGLSEPTPEETGYKEIVRKED